MWLKRNVRPALVCRGREAALRIVDGTDAKSESPVHVIDVFPENSHPIAQSLSPLQLSPRLAPSLTSCSYPRLRLHPGFSRAVSKRSAQPTISGHESDNGRVPAQRWLPVPICAGVAFDLSKRKCWSFSMEHRPDLALHDFKIWFGQLVPRVEQMHLPRSYATDRIAVWRSYFERGYSPREAVREELAYEAARKPRLPQVHRSSA
jgi:hypothetical protein